MAHSLSLAIGIDKEQECSITASRYEHNGISFLHSSNILSSVVSTKVDSDKRECMGLSTKVDSPGWWAKPTA